MLVSLTFFLSDAIYRHAVSGQYLMTDPDSTFFLRLYEQGMNRGSIPETDSYGCFPDRVKISYPPFHLNLLVETSLLLMTFFPDHQWTVSHAIGWFPPLFGWLVGLILAGYCWRKTRNKALVLLVAFACIPGLISTLVSQFLRIDYHFLNNFFIWAWLICACLYADERKTTWASLGTLTAFLFTMTWGGVPLFFLIVVIYSFWLFLKEDPLLEGFGEYAFISMLFSALLVFAYLFWAGKSSLDVGELGFVQPATLLVGALFVKILVNLRSGRISFAKNLASPTTLVLSGLLAVSFIGYVFFRSQIADGLNFIFVNDLAMQSIYELAPGIDFSRVILTESNLIDAMFKFSLLFFVFPLFYRFNPAGLFSQGGRPLKDFSILFIIMSILAARYFRWLGIAIGFWNGLALFFVWTLLSQLIGESEKKVFTRVRIAAALLLFMLLHFLMSYPLFYKSSVNPNSTLIDSLKWLQNHTPATSGYYDETRPEYCIYNYWHIGNLINYYGKRPTLTNNTMRGFAKMARVFTADTEEKAYALCEKYQVRYFYINSFYDFSDKIVRFMRAYIARSNVEDARYVFFPEYVDKPTGEKDFSQTFHYWLKNRLAMETSGNFDAAASRLRIVYCLEFAGIAKSPGFLIYELVEGALIQGVAEPASEVEISLDCRLHQVEKTYRRKVKVGLDGHFSCRIPYATSYRNGNVTTAETYRITWKKEGKSLEGSFSISENDVRKGFTVKAN